MKYQLLLALLVLTPVAIATELGVNYYHESLVSEQYQVPYIPRTPNQVAQDMQRIADISDHIKVYVNPFVPANADWLDTVIAKANDAGLHIAVNVMVDDRDLTDSNWGQYSANVLALCSRYSSSTDVFLVGNEIVLHSPWDKYQVRPRVEALINECEQRYDGLVSYEAFWFAKEAWYDYNKPIYFMLYENFNSFQTNVAELRSRFGDNGLVGEWGEDSIDSGTERDDWWQRLELERRWNVMRDANVPIAYVFTYKEPSWNAFGIVNPADGIRPGYNYLNSLNQGSGADPTPPQPEPPQPPPREEPEPEPPQPPPQEEPEPTPPPQPPPQQEEPVPQPPQQEEPEPAPTPPPQLEEPVPQPQVPEPTPVTDSNDRDYVIQNLAASCTSSDCQVTVDTSNGPCRSVTATVDGKVSQVLACEKSGDVIEAYLQQFESGASSVCLDTLCVGEQSSFARSTLSALSFDGNQELKNEGTVKTSRSGGGSGRSRSMITSITISPPQIVSITASEDSVESCREISFLLAGLNVDGLICESIF